jgi:hypothetical protein
MSIANYAGRDISAAENDTRKVRRSKLIERRDTAARAALTQRVVAEFHEMPCLRLTPAQAQRLFGLRDDICRRMMGALVHDGVLRVHPDGRLGSNCNF